MDDDVIAPPHFPLLPDFTQPTFAAFGYTARWVSVFDHWLSEAEACASPLIFHDLAMERGAGEAYLEGEARLLAFYRALLAGGALERRVEEVAAHNSFGAELAGAVVLSLREREMMDLYIPHLCLRVFGGYDRTDLLLFEDEASIPAVQGLADRCGVFLLA